MSIPMISMTIALIVVVRITMAEVVLGVVCIWRMAVLTIVIFGVTDGMLRVGVGDVFSMVGIVVVGIGVMGVSQVRDIVRNDFVVPVAIMAGRIIVVVGIAVLDLVWSVLSGDVIVAADLPSVSVVRRNDVLDRGDVVDILVVASEVVVGGSVASEGIMDSFVVDGGPVVNMLVPFDALVVHRHLMGAVVVLIVVNGVVALIDRGVVVRGHVVANLSVEVSVVIVVMVIVMSTLVTSVMGVLVVNSFSEVLVSNGVNKLGRLNNSDFVMDGLNNGDLAMDDLVMDGQINIMGVVAVGAMAVVVLGVVVAVVAGLAVMAVV